MLMASGNRSSSVPSRESVTESMYKSSMKKRVKKQVENPHNVMSTGIIGINIKHKLAWYRELEHSIIVSLKSIMCVLLVSRQTFGQIPVS